MIIFSIQTGARMLGRLPLKLSYGESLIMYMTSEDLHIIYHQAHQNVAKQLGIEDYEWKSTQELAGEIQLHNRQVASKLQAYIKAYEDLFEVHEQFAASRSSGNLSAEQNAKWAKATTTRDAMRKALLDEFARL